MSIATSPPPFKGLKEYQFEIQKETWNHYELEDHSILRARAIMSRMLRRSDIPDGTPATPLAAQPENPQFIGAFQTLAIVTPIDGYSNFGDPHPKPYTDEEMASAKSAVVNFKLVREDWNEYRFTDGSLLRVKVVVTNVVRYQDRFDELGIPIYNISSSIVTSPITRTDVNASSNENVLVSGETHLDTSPL